jgi:hypothetical protein
MSPAPRRPDEHPVGSPHAEGRATSGSEIPPDAGHDATTVDPEEPEAGVFQDQFEKARRLIALQLDVAEARRQLAEASLKITEAQLALAEKELEELKAENEQLRREIEALRGG